MSLLCSICHVNPNIHCVPQSGFVNRISPMFLEVALVGQHI